jgi:hypothetical protein
MGQLPLYDSPPEQTIVLSPGGAKRDISLFTKCISLSRSENLEDLLGAQR